MFKNYKSFVILYRVHPHTWDGTAFPNQIWLPSPPSLLLLPTYTSNNLVDLPKDMQRGQLWGQPFQHSSQVKPMPLGLSCPRSSDPFTFLGGLF